MEFPNHHIEEADLAVAKAEIDFQRRRPWSKVVSTAVHGKEIRLYKETSVNRKTTWVLSARYLWEAAKTRVRVHLLEDIRHA